MTARDDAQMRDALLRALQDELKLTLEAYPTDASSRHALPFRAYSDALHEARDVLDLRSAFALARRRSPDAPPTPADVRVVLRERQQRARGESPPAAAPVPAPDESAPRREVPTREAPIPAPKAPAPADTPHTARTEVREPAPDASQHLAPRFEPSAWRSPVTPLPPTPRFDDAAAWLAMHPEAVEEVDAELADLTHDWPPELESERERLRPTARLLVFNRRADRAAETA